RSYDMLISHTTIVFTRYILLAWEARQKADSKTLGGLFYLLCDEVKDIDVKTALVQLWAFMQRHLENSSQQEGLL
ncbi:IS4 family transposase, partial [Pseudomonas aeruginosa]